MSVLKSSSLIVAIPACLIILWIPANPPTDPSSSVSVLICHVFDNWMRSLHCITNWFYFIQIKNAIPTNWWPTHTLLHQPYSFIFWGMSNIPASHPHKSLVFEYLTVMAHWYGMCNHCALSTQAHSHGIHQNWGCARVRMLPGMSHYVCSMHDKVGNNCYQWMMLLPLDEMPPLFAWTAAMSWFVWPRLGSLVDPHCSFVRDALGYSP